MQKEYSTGKEIKLDHPIIFFDGVCGLCNSFVDIIFKADKKGIFKFSPLQGDTAKKYLPELPEQAGEWWSAPAGLRRFYPQRAGPLPENPSARRERRTWRERHRLGDPWAPASVSRSPGRSWMHTAGGFARRASPTGARRSRSFSRSRTGAEVRPPE